MSYLERVCQTHDCEPVDGLKDDNVPVVQYGLDGVKRVIYAAVGKSLAHRAKINNIIFSTQVHDGVVLVLGQTEERQISIMCEGGDGPHSPTRALIELIYKLSKVATADGIMFDDLPLDCATGPMILHYIRHQYSHLLYDEVILTPAKMLEGAVLADLLEEFCPDHITRDQCDACFGGVLANSGAPTDPEQETEDDVL